MLFLLFTLCPLSAYRANEPFNPYKRMAYHGYDFAENTGKSDEEITEGLKKLAEENKGVPHPIAKAKAIKYVLDNTRIDINEHDWFVGFWSVDRLAKATTLATWLDELRQNRLSCIYFYIRFYKRMEIFLHEL